MMLPSKNIFISFLVVLTGCSSTGILTGPQAESAAERDCEAVAQNYVLTHRIDKLWREHEYYAQYKKCVAEQQKQVNA